MITTANPTEAKKKRFTVPTGDTTVGSQLEAISKKDNSQEWTWQLCIQTEASS